MKKTIFFVLLSTMAWNTGAQTLRQTQDIALQEADRCFKAFKAEMQTGTRDTATYELLYQFYQNCTGVLQAEEKNTENQGKAKCMLLENFKFLCEAAVYFGERDDTTNTVKYTRSFVELALMDDFADCNLFSTPGFAQFPMFLGHHAYNSGHFQESIRYYKAYLETGDMEFQEQAFAEMVSAFYRMKLYDDAESMALSAVKKYPKNLDIIHLAVRSCEKGGLDQDFQLFLDLAKVLKPDDSYLLSMQAGLYERQRKYAEAAEVYVKLEEKNPDHASTSCHLAVDLYNAGVKLCEEASLQPHEADASRLLALARDKFREAVPYLRSVIDNYPYAVNMMHTLAMCQNVLEDSQGFQEANALLTGKKQKAVKRGDKPTLAFEYRPIADLPGANPAADSNLSDVDIDIPKAVKANSNKNTFVIIVGNEEYKHVGRVNFAKNDAKSFATYCKTLLGIPERNITLQLDATKSEMDQLIEKVAELAKMEPDQLNFLIYYAGHGLPDVIHGISYVVPTDADGSNFEYCYSLNYLYQQLDDMNAKSITVFLDACFSGKARNGGDVLNERFVFHDTNQKAEVHGRTVTFCAASGDQASLPYDEQHHGIFTYFLLKYLKESKGEISFGELADKLEKEVNKLAISLKNKRQSPQVQTSIAMEDTWETLKLPIK